MSKPKLIAIVGNDYIDENGDRKYIFQIVEVSEKGTFSVAIIQMVNDSITGSSYTKGMLPRGNAIIRLAKIYQSRSIPMCFK